MSDSTTGRSKRSPYTREQLLGRLRVLINEVARWAPGQFLKERMNQAAKELGLTASRADDLWRGEARRTDAEEYLNVLDRYEEWLEKSEHKFASFGRTHRQRIDEWRARHGSRGEAFSEDGTLCAAPDFGAADHHRIGVRGSGQAD